MMKRFIALILAVSLVIGGCRIWPLKGVLTVCNLKENMLGPYQKVSFAYHVMREEPEIE